MSEPTTGLALEIDEFDVVDIYPSEGEYDGCIAMIVSRDAAEPVGYAIALPHALETIAAVIYEPGTTLVVTLPKNRAHVDGKSVLAGAIRLRDGRVLDDGEGDDVEIFAMKRRLH